MKANINIQELENIGTYFSGLDQEKKKLTVQFECYGFTELHFIRQSIYEAIEKMAVDGDKETAHESLTIAKHLVNICKQIDKFEVNDFVDNLILSND